MHPESTSLALVESPVQLLHVIEWCSWHQAHDLQVAVLPPREGRGRTQLAAMRRIAEDSGLAVEWLDPRLSWGGPLWAWARLRRRAVKADRVLIGDPFSGLIQAIMSTARIAKVVVVDDGTATIDFAESLANGDPLLRWAVRTGRFTRFSRAGLAGRTSRLLRKLGPQGLELFTVMPVELDGIAEVTRHDYRWTRTAFGPPQVRDQVTVIGSSLVESGLLTEDAFVAAITEAMRSLGAMRGVYVSHRREDPEKLARLAAATGLTVVSSEVPLEIELRRGEVGRSVVCFPSTPAYTLPLVLSDTDIELTVLPAQPDWFHPDADARATDFVARLGDQPSEQGSRRRPYRPR
jgi:hypothetical protein